MNRRGFLVATGGTLALAGCASNGGDDDDEATVREGTAEIVESEVFAAPLFSSGGGEEVPWLQIDVENSSDAPHGRLRVESRFLSDGEVITTHEATTGYLPPETTWRYYTREEQLDLEAIDDVETEIADAEPQAMSTELEAATVLEENFSVGSTTVSISGEIDLGDEDPETVAVVVPVYDEGGRLRGTLTDTESDPTSSIEFSADTAHFRTPHERDEPDSYEILVFDGD